MLLLPISEYTIKGGQSIIFKTTGLVSQDLASAEIYKTTIILFFLCITVILPLITILFYKRRLWQMKLCLYNMVLLLGFQGFTIWFVWRIGIVFEAVTVYKFPLIFPVVSAILSYLAFRSVKKDENLIRSLDRIR